jgi:hypothetical protein
VCDTDNFYFSALHFPAIAISAFLMFHGLHWTILIGIYNGVESISLALNAAMEWLSLCNVQEVQCPNYGVETSCSDKVFIVVCPSRHILGQNLN